MKSLNKQIFVNTLKIVVAAIASIVIARAAGLNFDVSAGIVAILTIQPTKKETIKTAVGRLLAFLTALFIAYISFRISGYTISAFFLYLAVFIFVCQLLHWYSAMAMNSVLISHFLTVGNMSIQSVTNEMLIFIIGVGVGIIANLHLHKNVNYIEELKNGTDEQIKRILARMSERILNHDISDYNGECFFKLRNLIRKAKNVAEENYNNQFNNSDIYDIEYIKMRDRQYQVLYEMYKSVRNINTTPITAERISLFLKEISDVYNEDNTGRELMDKFAEMDESMKLQPLPVERKEFEDRARLFVLMRYMEEFIQIKIEFAEKYLKK